MVTLPLHDWNDDAALKYGLKMEELKKEEDAAARYVWGERKPKGTYKSVNIGGEVYEVGHCVQCILEGKFSFIWKIRELFQDGDVQKCRLRRLLPQPQLPPNVKGLESQPVEPKELFLASDGPDMQEDIPLVKIARRYNILCTFADDEQFNPIPTDEQVKKADYFFHRGYDAVNEEVVPLDVVVDELGAQFVYNKISWLGDNVSLRSSSQVSAARLPSQSQASGSSAHQSAAKGTSPSVPEVSPADSSVPEVLPAEPSVLEVSRDSTERKLKKRKTDNLTPKQPKVVDDALHGSKKKRTNDDDDDDEQTNEVLRSGSKKKRRLSKDSPKVPDHVIFALPAPAKLAQIGGQAVVPPATATATAKPTAKPVQRELGKSPSVKTVSSSPALPLKQPDAKKRKDGPTPSEGLVKKKVLIPGASSGQAKLQKRDDEVKTTGRPVITTASEGVKKALKRAAGLLPASKLQRRAEEESHVRKSHSTLNRVKNLNVEIPAAAEMPHGKTSRDASPRAPKCTDGGRKRDDLADVLHAPSASQRSPSVTVAVPAKKDTGSTPKDLIRPPLISPRISPKPVLDKSLSNRMFDSIFSSATSPTTQQQKPHGQIFKPVVEDWDTTIAKAVQANRVVLLGNVDPALHSDDLAEALTHSIKTRFDVRIVPPLSFSYRTTTAVLKLPSSKKAEEFVNMLKIAHLSVANRVVTASLFTLDQLRGKHGHGGSIKHPGHLEFSQVRDHHVDDYRNAVATSHLAQGNTIEFAYGLPWRVLDEQREEQWGMLQEEHSKGEQRAIEY